MITDTTPINHTSEATIDAALPKMKCDNPAAFPVFVRCTTVNSAMPRPKNKPNTIANAASSLIRVQRRMARVIAIPSNPVQKAPPSNTLVDRPLPGDNRSARRNATAIPGSAA